MQSRFSFTYYFCVWYWTIFIRWTSCNQHHSDEFYVQISQSQCWYWVRSAGNFFRSVMVRVSVSGVDKHAKFEKSQKKKSPVFGIHAKFWTRLNHLVCIVQVIVFSVLWCKFGAFSKNPVGIMIGVHFGTRVTTAVFNFLSRNIPVLIAAIRDYLRFVRNFFRCVLV